MLKATLTGENDHAGYAALGATLGMSEGAVKVAVHRLRCRYRELLRDEIAQSVASADQIDEEIQAPFAALGGDDVLILQREYVAARRASLGNNPSIGWGRGERWRRVC